MSFFTFLENIWSLAKLHLHLSVELNHYLFLYGHHRYNVYFIAIICQDIKKTALRGQKKHHAINMYLFN
jgi:hypothetical protein